MLYYTFQPRVLYGFIPTYSETEIAYRGRRKYFLFVGRHSSMRERLDDLFSSFSKSSDVREIPRTNPVYKPIVSSADFHDPYVR